MKPNFPFNPLVLALAQALACGVVMAQAPVTPVIPVALEKIEVTGSSIKRIEGETALPVQIIKRDAIEKSGVTTAEQLINTIAANVGSFGESLSISDVAGQRGFSGANLRGLGASSTLVLLNGRRVANYAFGGAGVDLNSIPLAAIDRVEVLKDGASAVYGADAVGGVINFITRKDYRGGELNTYIGDSQHGGAGRNRVGASIGFGDLNTDGWNAFISYEYQKTKALRAIDRDFARTAYFPAEGIDFSSSATFPANIAVGSRTVSPSAPGCAPPYSIFIASYGSCRFDYQALADISPASEKQNYVARGVFKLNADNELFAEYTGSRNHATYRISPSNIRLNYPVGGPFYPQGLGLSGPLSVRFRLVPVGQRISTLDSSSDRIVVGAQGNLAGWDYNTAYNHTVSKAVDHYVSGYVSGNAFRTAFATGAINPFGAQTASGQALLNSTQVAFDGRTGIGTTDAFDLRGAREIAATAAGPIALAIGFEARREKLEDRASEQLKQGVIINQDPTADSFGSRSIKAVFAELNVPVTKSIEAQLALRHDSYSDFGGTTNPKIALRWQPSREFLVRSAYGTGFRAPTMSDLFSSTFTSSTAGVYNDPLRCIGANNTNQDDCANQFRTTSGGNAALKPEKSKQFSLGMLFEPSRDFSVSVDYWSIQKSNVIVTLSDAVVFSDYARYASFVTRGPVESATPTLPGPITNINLPKINLGAQKVAGLDFELAYRLNLAASGKLDLRLSGTYINTSKQQFRQNGPYNSNLGVFFDTYATPRWRHRLSANWDTGNWGFNLAQSFQLGHKDQNRNPAGNERQVSAYSLWDGQVSYYGVKNVKVSAGIKNLLDTKPPFSNQSYWYVATYDPTYTDPRGRYFYVNASYRWK